MATKAPDFTERLKDFLARRPSLAEAQSQVEETVANLATLRTRLAATLLDADTAAVAASEGMPDAAKQRDTLRALARGLREEINDAELLLTKRQERLTDAKAAERAKAIEAIWAQAEIHCERREQAARACDDAIAALAKALDAVHHETALLHLLFEGKADGHLLLSSFRGTLGIQLTEATGGKKTSIRTRPLAELISEQHNEVRRATKL